MAREIEVVLIVHLIICWLGLFFYAHDMAYQLVPRLAKVKKVSAHLATPRRKKIKKNATA
ncbi:hypothetical protein DZF79_04950 [Vibrio parahaemolyticus]|nr:hypothetical protein [Vibrio parahaemolyticus]